MQACRAHILEQGGPLCLLLGYTAVRASHLRSGPSHWAHRRFLALYRSPPQPHAGRGILPGIWCRSSPGKLGKWQERGIAATAVVSGKAIKKTSYPPRPKVSEDEIEEKFLKGSGPGGQKINKTNSAVQLHHIPTGIVVKSQETRSREQNRKIARKILAEKLEELEKGPESRSVILKREESRKKRSKEKKARRKYAKLAAEKNNAVLAAGNEVSEGARESPLTEEREDGINIGGISQKGRNIVIKGGDKDDEFSSIDYFPVDENELHEDEDEEEDKFSKPMNLPDGLSVLNRYGEDLGKLDDDGDVDSSFDDTSNSDNDGLGFPLSTKINSGDSVVPTSIEIHSTEELDREAKLELEDKRGGLKEV